MVFVVLILLGFIGFIGYAYYLDYKADPKKLYRNYLKPKTSVFHPLNYTEIEEISEEEFMQSLQKVKQPIFKSNP